MEKTIERFSKYVNAELLVPMVDFCIEHALYPRTDLLRLKLGLLEQTSMVNAQIDAFRELNPDSAVPTALVDRRAKVAEAYSASCTRVSKFVDDFKSMSYRSSVADDDVWDAFAREFGYSTADVDSLLGMCRCAFECGELEAAADALEILKGVVDAGSDPARYGATLWARLGVEILLGSFHGALTDIRRLSEHMDKASSNGGVSRKRAALCHWAMFAFWSQPNGIESFLKFLLNDKIYLNVCIGSCPYLFEYVGVAAVILSSRKRVYLDDMIRLYDDERPEYFADPVNQFIKSVCVYFDFDQAVKCIQQLEKVLCADFFMRQHVQEFMNCARGLMFENFCRLHHCVGIDFISNQLNMSEKDTEEYIVRLANEGRLNARIDLENNCVVVRFQTTDPYKQLVEKMKNQTLRIMNLSNNYDRRRSIFTRNALRRD